jgi:hypothetical protein
MVLTFCAEALKEHQVLFISHSKHNRIKAIMIKNEKVNVQQFDNLLLKQDDQEFFRHFDKESPGKK